MSHHDDTSYGGQADNHSGSESTGRYGDTYNVDNARLAAIGGRNNTNTFKDMREDLVFTPPKVSLTDFCAYYDLDDQFENLKKLQFRPGYNLEEINDWKNYGFTSFSWNLVKDANRRFKNDAIAGKWNVTTKHR